MMVDNNDSSHETSSSIHESRNTADAGELQVNSRILPQSNLQPQTLNPSSPLDNCNLEHSLRSDRQPVPGSSVGYSTSSEGAQTPTGGSLHARIRRKPLPWQVRSTIPLRTANIKSARIGQGLWHDQLLVDRSLRTMAALMTIFAIAMFIVVAVNFKKYQDRPQEYTSSVARRTQDCEEVTRIHTALLFIINLAATMILGMSNTYQQLLTSLEVCDLKHMLQNYGDSRVGTNSPFNINHKVKGKRKSWAAWILLITTSLPVHFLANSLIGPSYISEPPTIVKFDPISNATWASSVHSDERSFLCWSAFRTGKAQYPGSAELFDSAWAGESWGKRYSMIQILYNREVCGQYANDTELDMKNLEKGIIVDYNGPRFVEGACTAEDLRCSQWDPVKKECRLNLRMNAAFVLLGCLVIKAIYMISVNIVSRGKLKRQLLTFGDVIAASASDPEWRVQGECMVNACDSFQRRISHTCHRHCKSKRRSKSKTGDEVGHCQKCLKWNSIDRFTDKQQPAVATKLKKSLISNIGNTAVSQITLLIFCCIILLLLSITAAVRVKSAYEKEKYDCQIEIGINPNCEMSNFNLFTKLAGGFGGLDWSLTLGALPMNRLDNEFVTFCISNGAQFIYSLLYLMLIYYITLISQEHDWGKLEHTRKRIRCTIVRGDGFSQDYVLQLPKKILYPVMTYSVLTHWMLGEALQTREAICRDNIRNIEFSQYAITYATYPLWIATLIIMLMTCVCWWAYTYKREGFIPQMFGSIRVLCAATSSLDDFPPGGIMWGDFGYRGVFKHAGLSAEEVDEIAPLELYA